MDYTNKDYNAFPVFDSKGECSVTSAGLTKREYFAAMALNGLLSANVFDEDSEVGVKKLCEKAATISDVMMNQLEAK